MKTRISSPQAKIRPRPADENPDGLEQIPLDFTHSLRA